MDVFERNPLQYQPQFMQGDLDGICRILYFRYLKRSLLEPFVADRKTGLVPHLYLDQRSGPFDKNVDISRKRLLAQRIDH